MPLLVHLFAPVGFWRVQNQEHTLVLVGEGVFVLWSVLRRGPKGGGLRGQVVHSVPHHKPDQAPAQPPLNLGPAYPQSSHTPPACRPAWAQHTRPPSLPASHA